MPITRQCMRQLGHTLQREIPVTDCKYLIVGAYKKRTAGLKIPGPERGVTVRFRPRAPVNPSRLGHFTATLRRARVVANPEVGMVPSLTFGLAVTPAQPGRASRLVLVTIA